MPPALLPARPARCTSAHASSPSSHTRLQHQHSTRAVSRRRQAAATDGTRHAPPRGGTRPAPPLAELSMSASRYDNPALYSNDDAFSERRYWDRRYQEDPTTFEWYQSWGALQPILTEHLPQEQPVLQLGVGTSRIQEDMADAGWQSINSIDYSPVAIKRLLKAYPARPGLSYAVADARAMPQYPDESVGGVLDKGTLDALLCGDADVEDAARMLGEVWRVLAPGGAYVMVTSASPRSRLRYLQTPALPWQRLLVYEVGQQGARSGPFACACAPADGQAAAADGAGNQSSQQHADAEQVLALPQLGYSHLVYVCVKP